MAQSEERRRQPPWCHHVLSLKSFSGPSDPSSPHNPAGVFDSRVALIRPNTVSQFLTLNKSKPEPHMNRTFTVFSFHQPPLLKQNLCFLLFQTGNELTLLQSGSHRHALLLKEETFCFQKKRRDENLIHPNTKERKREITLSLYTVSIQDHFGFDRFKSPHLKLMSSAPSHWHPGSL